MIKKTLKDIKLGSGTLIPAGTELTLALAENGIKTAFGARTVRLSYRTAKANFGAPFTKEPGLATMEKWSDSGIARSVTGTKSEPDGYGESCGPSWLRALGMI